MVGMGWLIGQSPTTPLPMATQLLPSSDEQTGLELKVLTGAEGE
eukprot:CAMPEP_0174928662 /NCGR_PEP_ID=MMETSP1355-20121228/25116_1 /TAXON_ID=464990 /ORGANISM="Hemiselmis tepida, Strain CCMP443" /LENGTH=43 /DNA_ID= /DNA_START= /DNA_END= /DNA_ORIENTATION=